MLLLALGCSSVPGLTAARKVDLVALRATLDREKLSPSEVRRIAEELLASEIVKAKDREDRPFVRSVRLCSTSLYGALGKRSETKDGVGAEAALLLLEAGRLSNPGKYEKSEDGAWRALAARASKGDGALRRKYFSDPDERVRREALSAALEAADEKDVPLLLEVSRLDPDPMSRSRAYSALAKIGGPHVSRALLDRFEVADEPMRLAIVDAWSKDALYKQGGRDQLKHLMNRGAGFDALHAARTLSRDDDEATKNEALNHLVRFSRDGSAEERRMAIVFLPSHEEITVRRLLELAETEDDEVAVIAWARLLGNRHYSARAEATLFAWADSDAPVAHQARAALAAGGDERVKPLLLQQMRAKDVASRSIAGSGLLRLGALSELAPLLADEDAGLRRGLACETIARPYLTETRRDD